MPETKGKNIILQLRKKWIYQRMLLVLMTATVITLFISTLLHKLLQIPVYWGIPLLVFIFIFLSAVRQWWKLSESDITRFLNQSEPALQESSELVLLPYDQLNLLQKLQLQKVETQLGLLHKSTPLKKNLISASFILLLVVLVCVVIFRFPISQSRSHPNPYTTASVPNTIHQKLLPQLESQHIVITPPSYTGKPARTQEKFDVQVEEGGMVSWDIKTNTAVNQLALVFNDGTHLPLVVLNKQERRFKAQKAIVKSGFYQVDIAGKLSELYKIEVIKDQVPTIVIQTPKPNTIISYGQPENVFLKVNIADDYGIKAAAISATISSGEGEAVKFKEQTLSFSNFAAGRQQYNLQKILDLKGLGMQPGDELYFFVMVTDTRNQESRSDVYIVTIQDTTQSLSMNGMVNGLDIKPEMFRSERQIIIETEQLLKDRSTITPEEFKKRSNDLGVDQRLLRLRYGKFLGEETDTEIGEHEQGQHGSTDNAAEILEQYGHSHDNADDADFFDAATKKQLKATLAEMWNAELQLRTFKPKEALPFEYKALHLLKDLQQKSRAYVAKTGFTTTPLKTDKRLTGDLSKIIQPVTQQHFEKENSSLLTTRKAIGTLEQLKYEDSLDTPSQEILQQAFQQLSAKASQNPSLFLPAVSALKKVLSGAYYMKDISVAENGIQKMLDTPAKLPSASAFTADMNLSGRYFMNLNSGIKRK